MKENEERKEQRPVLLGFLLVVSIGLFVWALIWSVANTPITG